MRQAEGFFANLHTKNRFARRKKLSRKRPKTYTNSLVSICQVDDDIIDVIMMITIKFSILWSFLSHVAKFQN